MAKRMPWDDIVTGGVRVIGPCVEDDVVANPRDWERVSSRSWLAGYTTRGVPVHVMRLTDGSYAVQVGFSSAHSYSGTSYGAASMVDARRIAQAHVTRRALDNPGEILDSYHARRGDRITFEFSAGHRTVRGTGTVVMASGSGDGWVLNMGGAHGTPQVIRHEHVVRVTRPKSRASGGGLLDSRPNPAIKVGDIVMASAQHLRSAGIYSGPEAFTKWRVTSLSGNSSFSIANLVSLGGPDSYAAGTKRKYNCANLVLADRRHLEPNPRGHSCPYCGGDPGIDCRRCDTKPPRTERNPPLILVHALNPPVPVEVERAWKRFHQRDECDAKTVDIGKIPGTPDFTFALGRCVNIEIDGRKCPFQKGKPWLVYDPSDQALWIVTAEPMNLGGGVAGSNVTAVTYDPVDESGKDPNALFRHEFDVPYPTLSPVGNPRRCRAILLDGGVYRVTDWVRN